MRPGNIASKVRKSSATRRGLWLGNMMPPAPIRIVDVSAATRVINNSGAVQASDVMLWCSANHCRR